MENRIITGLLTLGVLIGGMETMAVFVSFQESTVDLLGVLLFAGIFSGCGLSIGFCMFAEKYCPNYEHCQSYLKDNQREENDA